MSALGHHTLLDFYGCDVGRLKRSRDIKSLLCAAVRGGDGRIVKALFHNFSPYGVSGVVVITESHVTIHTWPEHGYAAVDIFSCSVKLDHAAIRKHLKQALGAKRVSQRSFRRGMLGKTFQAGPFVLVLRSRLRPRNQVGSSKLSVRCSPSP